MLATTAKVGFAGCEAGIKISHVQSCSMIHIILTTMDLRRVRGVPSGPRHIPVEALTMGLPRPNMQAWPTRLNIPSS